MKCYASGTSKENASIRLSVTTSEDGGRSPVSSGYRTMDPVSALVQGEDLC